MGSLDLGFRLNQPQFDAFSAVRARTTVFYGWGRGVGKSWFSRLNWWLQVAEWDGKRRDGCPNNLRGVRIMVLMPTLKQFKDVHWDGIVSELGPGGQWEFLGAKLNGQRGEITFPGGSVVRPFPAAEHTSKKARGMRVDILCADEIDDIDPDVYYAIAIPCLSEPWSLGIELLGGTPTRGRHGLWYAMRARGEVARRLRAGELSEDDALNNESAQDILMVFEGMHEDDWPEGVPKGAREATIHVLRSYYGFHATYKDAPETVSALAVARARSTTPLATFQREWEANPDAGEGVIYAFDERFHVRHAPRLMDFTSFGVGVDHGDVDPGVMILFGIVGSGRDAVAWAIDEWYEPGQLNSVWDKRIKEWQFPIDGVPIQSECYADPSRKDRIRDWRNQGCNMRDLPADVKPIKAGLARVQDLLHIRRDDREGCEDWCRLYVDPRCKNLIREFGMYRWKKAPDGTFLEKPADGFDHAMDAMRYFLAGHFGPITGGRSEHYGS